MRSSSTQQLFRLQVVEGPPCPSLFREQLEASLKRLRQENRRLMMERQILIWHDLLCPIAGLRSDSSDSN